MQNKTILSNIPGPVHGNLILLPWTVRIRNIPRPTYFLQDENKEKADKLLYQVDSLKVLNIIISYSLYSCLYTPLLWMHT